MSNKGFSLLELLIAISVSSVLVIAVSNFAASSLIGSNQDYNKTLVLTNAKEAVSIVQRQVRMARSVQSSNSQPDANAPGAPGDLYSWSGAAGNGNSLILAVPARNSSGDLIYIDGLHTTLYTDNVIFFLDSSTKKLFRRFIKNENAPGNVGVTTCPVIAATSTCPVDATVVDDVANLSTAYLDSGNAAVSLPSGTEAVNYTVTETRTINGKSYSGTYTSLGSLRNK